jgi:hypothetical protein
VTKRIAFALVSASYLIGMDATFPIKKVRTKPRMVQSDANRYAAGGLEGWLR